MEVSVRNVTWLMAAGLVAVTAGCTESSGYPNSSYSGNRGYYNNAYNNNAYNSNGYYANDGRYYTNNRYNSGYGQPAYNQPAYNTGYAGIIGAILGQANNQPTYYDARRGGW